MAVKVVTYSRKQKEQLTQEAALSVDLRHPNIVTTFKVTLYNIITSTFMQMMTVKLDSAGNSAGSTSQLCSSKVKAAKFDSFQKA